MIISKTPLRISFAGGGSDLPSYFKKEPGKVISSSINKYVYVIIKERFDDMIYINYSKKEIVSSVDNIEHVLVREAMKKTGIRNGVEITTLSDIPSSGSGLGSSSAITVGLLNAMYNYKNIIKSQQELAEEACHIEINICKNPIGKQDQYGCALGGVKKIKFNTDGKVEFKLIDSNFSELDRNLYLCYTDITRSANTILSKQSKSSKKNKLKNSMLVSSVDEFEEILFSGSLDKAGNFLDKMWKIKKEMAEGISNDSIEKLYQKGINAGALGGKVLGAGGGGFILFYVPRNNQKAFEDKMIKNTFLDFNFETHGSKIIFVEG
tara:strand:+ start:10691 stop:11656 length:966 start_codon:yes stop_codon:yes gene_type:complete